MSGPLIPEEQIRSLVRKRMTAGELPVMRIQNIVGGYGRGALCCACGEQIQQSHIEYEATLAAADTRLFHIKCFSLWQLECAQQLETQRTSPASHKTPRPDGTGEARGYQPP